MPGVSLGWQNTVVPESASVMRTPAASRRSREVVEVFDVERHVVDARAEAVGVAEPAGGCVAGLGREAVHRLDRRLTDDVDRRVTVPVRRVVAHHAQRREHGVEEELGVGKAVDQRGEMEQLADPGARP